jgi:hypothetical protein
MGLESLSREAARPGETDENGTSLAESCGKEEEENSSQVGRSCPNVHLEVDSSMVLASYRLSHRNQKGHIQFLGSGTVRARL